MNYVNTICEYAVCGAVRHLKIIKDWLVIMVKELNKNIFLHDCIWFNDKKPLKPEFISFYMFSEPDFKLYIFKQVITKIA